MFITIIIDEGCWSDPTVYGPFETKQQAETVGTNLGATSYDAATPANLFETVFLAVELEHTVDENLTIDQKLEKEHGNRLDDLVRRGGYAYTATEIQGTYGNNPEPYFFKPGRVQVPKHRPREDGRIWIGGEARTKYSDSHTARALVKRGDLLAAIDAHAKTVQS